MDKNYGGSFDKAYDEIVQLARQDINKAKELYSRLTAEGKRAVNSRLPETMRKSLEAALAGARGPSLRGKAPTEPIF